MTPLIIYIYTWTSGGIHTCTTYTYILIDNIKTYIYVITMLYVM